MKWKIFKLIGLMLIISVLMISCTAKTPEIKENLDFAEDAFTYVGESYQYTLSSDLLETITSQIGEPLDVLKGAGTLTPNNKDGNPVIGDTPHTTDYSVEAENILTVYYESDDSSLKTATQYTFSDKSIDIYSYVVSAETLEEITSWNFKRDFLCDRGKTEKRVSSNWEFPRERDFPYRVFDSVVDIYELNEDTKMYSFHMGEAANPASPFEYYPEDTLILNGGKPEVMCSLVFESNDKLSDTRALFNKNHMPVAVKIEKVSESENNTTLFLSSPVKLNISVIKLKDKSMNCSVQYKVYDYYGNVLNDTLVNKKISNAEDSFELPIEFIDDKYGEHFLELTVNADGQTYHELYPFAILKPSDYKNDTISPFGVSGVRFGRYEPCDDTVAIIKMLGIDNLRVCMTTPDYLEKDYTLLSHYMNELKTNGVKLLGQILVADNWTIPDDPDEYKKLADELLASVGKTLSAFEIGNENNNTATESELYEAMDKYMEKQFWPAYSSAHDNGIPVAGAGILNSQQKWMELASDSGLWEAQDILSTHAYSWKHAPESITEDQTGFLECLNRTSEYLASIGSDKPWYMTEFGAHTAALYDMWKFSGVNPRTQADFVIREFMLGLSSGTDVLMNYSLYDGQNLLKRIDPADGELNFGMFYAPDYYGRVMPKPLAVAYANMTRNLEDIAYCDPFKIVDETKYVVRCHFKNLDSNVYAAWSTKEILSTEKGMGFRLPCQLWENQWKETETLVWNTDKKLVIVEDIMGNQQSLETHDGIVAIPLTGSPLLIREQ